MARPPGSRRLRLVLAAAALATFATDLASVFLYVGYWSAGPRVELHRGRLSVMWMTDGSSNFISPTTGGWRIHGTRPPRAGLPRQPMMYFRPSVHESTPIAGMGTPMVIHGSSLPLWIPLVLTGIPAAVLWRRARRPTPGLCGRCGYDLAGNTAGLCPECGCRAQDRP